MPRHPIVADFKPTGGGSSISHIAGGQSFDCEVILDGITISDLVVTVTIPDTAPVAMAGGTAIPGGIQAPLTVAANSDRGLLACSASSVSSNTSVMFTADANGGSASGAITVTP